MAGNSFAWRIGKGKKKKKKFSSLFARLVRDYGPKRNYADNVKT